MPECDGFAGAQSFAVTDIATVGTAFGGPLVLRCKLSV